jgi:hypothetical protein
MGYQVAQYTEDAVVTGLVTVQGQLVTVMVWLWIGCQLAIHKIPI